jgi:ankyrin repeat protein
VEDYVGAPEKPGDLERKIDEVAGTKRWVSIDPPSLHEEYLRGWNVRGPEAQTLLCQAAQAGDAEVVKAFIDHGAAVDVSVDSETPLQFARGVEVVKLLITAGANVSAPSETIYGAPLGYAANRGDVAALKALLKAGAKVNGTSLGGRTALMHAAESGNPEAVKALLLAGADVHARDDDGQDALKHARFGLTSKQCS